MVVEVVKLPDFQQFNYARLGAFSLSTHSIKYIALEDVCEYNNLRETVAYHYRDFIARHDIKFPRKKAPDATIAYPYFAKTSRLPSAMYLDIRRAFQQIALSIGFNVWFKEGKAFGYGDNTPNEPLFSEQKTARGLIVSGHGEKARYTEWKYGKLETKSFANSNYAPYLRYAIWQILHAIMVKLKPFIYYAHTDGVIINSRMIERVDKIFQRYNIQYAIKHEGSAIIKGVGCYKIGDYQTGTFNLNGWQSKDFIIESEYTDWWLEKFVKGQTLR